MVCYRCIRALKTAFLNAGIEVLEVSLGKVVIHHKYMSALPEIEMMMKNLGFEIILEKHSRVIGTVKALVDACIAEERGWDALTAQISHASRTSYDSVSAIFAQHEGITIEQYLIRQRIRQVKKLLRETDLTLTEISYRTRYSSVHYLSKQFKMVEGLNPSEYRAGGQQKK